MYRRDLLLSALSATALLPAGRLYAAPQSDQRMLVVFLRGAYDAANIIVPVASDFYYECRPTIAIQKKDALPLDGNWGLHPALKDSIYPLWQKNQICFVPFAGSDDVSRSHFETQDTLELGQPLGGSRNYQSGFMNRLAGVISGSAAIAFTNQVPLCFRGELVVPNIALNFSGHPSLGARDMELIENMYRGQELAPAVAQGFSVQNEVYQVISAEMLAASRNAVSPKGFELSAERIAMLMRNKFNLGFVDVGGWDTHVNQGGIAGYLPARVAELGRGLNLLADKLGDHWKNTIVIVVSEFGRTFRENGDRGTDHGHGSIYWVLGGSVRGGRLAGRQVEVNQTNLFQNRDWPVLNNYRSMIGGILAKLYGFDAAQIDRVFPSARPEDLDLV